MLNVEELYEELIDRYACDADHLLVLCKMVAELEVEVEALKRKLGEGTVNEADWW